jgi:hypothetical protein
LWCSVILANRAETEKKVGRKTKIGREIAVIGMIEIVTETGVIE